MVHQVHAVRQGSGALLSCGVCRDSSVFDEADIDGINGFVHEHKLCLETST